MQEILINIEHRLVKAAFEQAYANLEKEGTLYKIVMESPDLLAVLEHARGLGYRPESFHQTINDGSHAHLRLKPPKKSAEYARITSFKHQRETRYRLYVPHRT